MSVQACEIELYGYVFDYEDNIFGLDDKSDSYTYCDLLSLNLGYYDMRDWTPHRILSAPKLVWISDGMNGDYQYLGFIKTARYILNTHGDNYWRTEFPWNSYIEEYAQEKIELVLRHKMSEPPKYHIFEHYS